MNKERKKKCPRCGAVITFYPAISRKDNKTEICSDCGVIEAIEEYINHKNKLEKIQTSVNENYIGWTNDEKVIIKNIINLADKINEIIDEINRQKS